MASELLVNKITPESGTTLTLGESGDTISFGTGTTPQLGGDLDLNSNDITGTGNINITGTATVSGDLTVDTDTLYVDSSNNRVGVGTTSPDNLLHIFSSSPKLIIQDGGTHGTNSAPRLEFKDNSSIQGFVDFADDGTMRVNQLKAYPLTFRTNNVERMRIDSSGNVGIGTSSAGAKFQVNSGTGIIAKFIGNNANNYIQVSDNNGTDLVNFGSIAGGNAYIYSTGYNAFYSGGSERMRIDSSGNVLVGTTSSYGGMINFLTSASRITGIATRPATNITYNAADFQNSSGTGVGGIGVTSSSTTFSTSSDYRLKEDWQPMLGSIDRLKNLNPVNFAWKVDGSRVDGFLAHEAQEVVPQAVTGEKDGVDDQGNPEYQWIDHSKLVPLLTGALQEAIAKIETLEVRLNALES